MFLAFLKGGKMSLMTRLYTRLIWKKKVAESLEKKNCSLRRQRNTACAGLVGLAALSICSIASCRQKEIALSDARREKANMKAVAEYFQKDAADLALENQRLKEYENFVYSIDSFHPDMPDCRTKEEEQEAEKQNAQKRTEWDDACKKLGINPVQLSRLKEIE